MSDLLLLALLLGEPKHGYALKKLAAFITGQRDLHNNVLYPALRKFVNEGWVSSRSVAGNRGQTRVLYSLSAKGKAELLRRLAEFGPKEIVSLEAFRLRVGLFDLLDADSRVRILAARKTWNNAREKRLLDLQTRIKTMGATDWGQESAEFALTLVRLEQEWITRLERKTQLASRAKPFSKASLKRRSA